MHRLRYPALAVIAILFSMAPAQRSQAQISIRIGSPPVCPYECAPYGYYGSDWFVNGVFIGAGPWYHGPTHFWGHVDNHYDRHDGYRGEYPSRGEHYAQNRRPDHAENFRGNEMRDGHGHSNLGREHEHGEQEHEHGH